MYSLVRSSHPAMGVEHSLSCHFFNAGEKNLVVAGANLLRVFRFVPDLDVRSGKEEEQGRLKMGVFCQLGGDVWLDPVHGQREVDRRGEGCLAPHIQGNVRYSYPILISLSRDICK